MFMGPLEDVKPWSTKGISGARRFLDRIFSLVESNKDKDDVAALDKFLHQTIKKVGDDILTMKYNTAISAMMIFLNKAVEVGIGKNQLKKFLLILSPFAPYLCEELWEKIGDKESICKQSWPQYDPNLVKNDEVEIVVQVNGKVRDKIMLPADLSQEEAHKIIMESEKVKKFVANQEVVKEIFVPNKLINIVIK